MCGSLRLNEPTPSGPYTFPGSELTIEYNEDGLRLEQKAVWKGWAKQETLSWWRSQGYKPALITGVNAYTERCNIPDSPIEGKVFVYPLGPNRRICCMVKENEAHIVTRPAKFFEKKIKSRFTMTVSIF